MITHILSFGVRLSVLYLNCLLNKPTKDTLSLPIIDRISSSCRSRANQAQSCHARRLFSLAYPNPPALAAAVPSPNTLPPVEPRGLEKVGAEPNAGTPPNPGDPPKVGGLPNIGAAPKPPEQNRGKKRAEKSIT